MKVYFLRHGESEYNVKKLINQDSKIDVSLSKKGLEQVEKVAKKFKNIKFDVIFSSEFLRARQTAEIINKFHNVPIVIDYRINEGRVGFEGKHESEHNKFLDHDPVHRKLKNHESWNDVVARVDKFLKELKKQKFSVVLVVTHDWVLRAVNKIVNNLDEREAFFIKFGNCEYFEFEL